MHVPLNTISATRISYKGIYNDDDDKNIVDDYDDVDIFGLKMMVTTTLLNKE